MARCSEGDIPNTEAREWVDSMCRRRDPPYRSRNKPTRAFLRVAGILLIMAKSDLEFWTWVNQYQKKKGTPLLTAEMQRRLVEEAGFVDIQVIEKCIDFGSWSEGLIPLHRNLLTSERSGFGTFGKDRTIRHWIGLTAHRYFVL